MTVRTDITVDFKVSPRLITIAAPSTEITIQDLYDTLRAIEDNPNNLDDDFLISAGGKENLGGSVLVGITATLNNAQLTFASRRFPITTGIVTSSGSPQIGSPTSAGSPPQTGRILNDSIATFLSDGVGAGDIIFNCTDLSVGEVSRVNSETEIFLGSTSCDPSAPEGGLGGGFDNTFETGDVYAIYDIVQCNIAGGNLVAVDTLGDALDSVFPTFGTQIVRTSSSSATLQELLDIQFASFQGAVTVDVTSLFSGTTFPLGTKRQPVNNFSDAISIANSRGLNQIDVIGDATLPSGVDFTNFIIMGQSPVKSIITVDPAAITLGTEYTQCELTGTIGADTHIMDCIIRTITMSSGLVENSFLDGIITFLASADDTNFIECRDLSSTGSSVILDLTSTTGAVIFRNYTGAVEFTNIINSNSIVIDLIGRIVVGATNTTGTVTVRGIGTVEGTSGGTAINDNNFIYDAGGRGFGGM